MTQRAGLLSKIDMQAGHEQITRRHLSHNRPSVPVESMALLPSALFMSVVFGIMAKNNYTLN